MQVNTNPFTRPLRAPVTLRNGRVVTYAHLSNGAQDASMLDGGCMSLAEYAELCAVERMSSSDALALGRHH